MAFNDLEKQFQKITIDLIGINDLALTQSLLKESQMTLDTIREAISNTSDIYHLKQLDAWQLKWFQLKLQIEARKNLLETRKNLYGQTELPELNDFEVCLDQLSAAFPVYVSMITKYKLILQSVMRIHQQEISLNDIHLLRTFVQEITPIQAFDLIRPSVEQLERCLNKTYNQKKALLKQFSMQYTDEQLLTLLSDLSRNSVNQSQEIGVKLECFSFIGQVLYNPFEPCFNPIEFLNSLIETHSDNKKLLSLCLIGLDVLNKKSALSSDNFWSYRNSFDRLLHENIKKGAIKSKQLLDAKQKGLKIIQTFIDEQKNNENANTLIVGSGPGGLLHAINCAINSQPYRLVEKREKEKPLRLNTIVLGKLEPKELEILAFLGVLTDLEDKASFAHYKPMYMEVKLGDVEKALENALITLSNGINPIQYDTRISNIDATGQATLINKNGQIEDTHPKMIIVTDGAKGETKSLVGIDQRILAKPNFLIFSILKNKDELSFSTLFKSIYYQTTQAIKGLWLALKIGFYALFYQTSLEEAYGNVSYKGPSCIFRLPDQDYLLSVLREDGQKIFSEYKNRLDEIDLKIKFLQNEIRMPPQDSSIEALIEKISTLEEIKKSVNKEKDDAMIKHAYKIHGTLDFLQTIINSKGHQMKSLPMEVKNNYMVEVVVSMAEKSMVDVNGTMVLVRGDADHITDPYSGTGCKTALEEVLADQYFLSGDRDIMAQMILQWGHKHYQSKTLDVGFFERLNYQPGTETAARYAEKVLQTGTITQQEYFSFIKMVEKKSNNLVFSETENKLRFILLNKLEAKIIALQPDVSNDLQHPTSHFFKRTKDRRALEYQNSSLREIAEKTCKDSKTAPFHYLYRELTQMKSVPTALEEVAFLGTPANLGAL